MSQGRPTPCIVCQEPAYGRRCKRCQYPTTRPDAPEFNRFSTVVEREALAPKWSWWVALPTDLFGMVADCEYQTRLKFVSSGRATQVNSWD